MRIFTVHENPNPLAKESLVLIKDGFCWPALFFSFLWPLFEGLWFTTFISLGILTCGIVLIENFFISNNVIFLFLCFFNFIYAFVANDIRRMLIIRRGWQSVAIVQGKNFQKAEERFFSFCQFANYEGLHTSNKKYDY